LQQPLEITSLSPILNEESEGEYTMGFKYVFENAGQRAQQAMVGYRDTFNPSCDVIQCGGVTSALCGVMGGAYGFMEGLGRVAAGRRAPTLLETERSNEQ
jgi:hypothetical protein